MALVARWKLNNLLDSSGNGYDLTDELAVSTTGLYSTAYSYLTGNHTLPYNSAFDLGIGKPKSFSFWTYLNSIGSTQVFLSKDTYINGTRDWTIGIYISGQMRWFIKDSIDQANQQADINVDINNYSNVWFHVTAVYDGLGHAASNMKFYINGTEAAVTTNVDNIVSINQSSAPINLGCTDDGSRRLNGKLQDVRIYDHALTPKEVEQIYLTPVLHLDFNEERVAGEYITDVSGWDNHGLIQGNVLHNTASYSIGNGCYEIDDATADQYIDTGFNLNYDDINGLAFIAWITPRKLSENMILFGYKEGSPFTGFAVGIDNFNSDAEAVGRITLHTGDGAGWDYFPTSPVMDLDASYHIAVVLDKASSLAYLYIDGIGYGPISKAFPSKPAISTIRFGYTYLSSTYWGDFILDDPRIYPFALTPDQIRSLYQSRQSIGSVGDLYLQGEVVENVDNIADINFENWTLTGSATIDENGHILMTQFADTATSPFIPVPEGIDYDIVTYTLMNMEVYCEGESPTWPGSGGRVLDLFYYDENFVPCTSSTGFTSNGHAMATSLSEWFETYLTYYSQNIITPNDPNVPIKYMKFRFRRDNVYSSPTISLRYPRTAMGNNELNIKYSGGADWPIVQEFQATGNIECEEIDETGPTDGLVGWWPLDGDTEDKVSDGDGTINGTVIDAVFQKNSLSKDFGNLLDTYIDTGKIISIPNDGFSIAFWLKRTDMTNYTAVCGTGFSTGWGIFTESASSTNNIGLRLMDSGLTIQDYVTNYQLQQDEWTHVVFTFEGPLGYITAYINGVEDTKGPEQWLLSDFSAPTANFWIGTVSDRRLSYTSPQHIADVRIYNRVLSEEDAVKLYRLYSPSAAMSINNDNTIQVNSIDETL